MRRVVHESREQELTDARIGESGIEKHVITLTIEETHGVDTRDNVKHIR